MDFEIEKFNPTKAELTRLVAESKTLALPDQFDQIQLRRVKDARLNLRDARVAITKTGKTLREDALKFQKSVIAKEKELISIIEPEENRLAALEEQADRAIERKARTKVLPQRKERLAAIGDGIFETDDHLLDMADGEFETYCNERVAAKNEGDRLKLLEDQRRIDEEKAEIERKKDLADAEERGRKEASEKAERERKDREEREQREKEEAAERERREKERLEREENYQAFMKQHGYSDETKDSFHIERGEHEVRLYKLTGVLKIN